MEVTLHRVQTQARLQPKPQSPPEQKESATYQQPARLLRFGSGAPGFFGRGMAASVDSSFLSAVWLHSVAEMGKGTASCLVDRLMMSRVCIDIFRWGLSCIWDNTRSEGIVGVVERRKRMGGLKLEGLWL